MVVTMMGTDNVRVFNFEIKRATSRGEKENICLKAPKHICLFWIIKRL